MKRILFIYNPHAGKGLIKSRLSDILDIISKAGYEIVAYPTQGYKDAYYKVMEFTEEYDRVICSGGDGTLDEVVTGMMMREHKIPIGYIPAGTTNDFANSLQIPKDMLEATHVATSGKGFACDIGSFNDDIFVYIAAFGLFTDVSYQTKQEVKNVLGHLAYVLEGATRLLDIPSHHMRITHDGEVIEDDFVYGMVTNSRSVGGFRNMVDQNVKFDDGKFEVTLIKTPKSASALQEIIAALLISQVNTDYMYTFKTNKIQFESMEQIPWTLDGEFGGQHDDVMIKNNRKALEIIVSEKAIEHLSKRRKKKKLAEALENRIETKMEISDVMERIALIKQ